MLPGTPSPLADQAVLCFASRVPAPTQSGSKKTASPRLARARRAASILGFAGCGPKEMAEAPATSAGGRAFLSVPHFR